MNAPSNALFNGGPVPDLTRHRGLNYGDGVFRTCLIYASHVIDLEQQCDVANQDAARLGLAGVSVATLVREAAGLAAGQERGVLKIMLMRGGPGRGYRGGDATTDRLLSREAAPHYRAAAWDRGVTAFRSSFRLAAQPALAGIKHLNRLEQVLASRPWEEGADEALLGDDTGRPLCGTRTNLFWLSGGVLRTPALERCGVSGWMRRKVIGLAGTARLETRVQPGDWDELLAAEEAFLTNSLIGIWPLARLGERRWAAPGPVTRELMQRLAHPRWVEA